jgi:hypothetical protein
MLLVPCFSLLPLPDPHACRTAATLRKFGAVHKYRYYGTVEEGRISLFIMHLPVTFGFLFLLSLLIAGPLDANPPKRLTLTQAIRVAEKFVVMNGYTDLPPTQDKAKLAYESVEWEGNVQRMLELRHDTIERRAYGYVEYSRRGSGWTVVFRHKVPSVSSGRQQRIIPIRSDNNVGRAVTMDLFGHGMRVEHTDFLLKACTRVK